MKVFAHLALLAASAAAGPNFYAFNYDTRANQWGGCKDWGAMDADFATLSKITNIVRIYSMDPTCTKRVLDRAGARGMKVWLGMWSEVPTAAVSDHFDNDLNNLKSLLADKVINNDNVMGLQVSSEALYRYYVQGPGNVTGAADRRGIDTLTGHLSTARDVVRKAGLTFPVVITDIMDMYTMFPTLYELTDVVAENQFSMWQNISPEDGAHFTFMRYQEEETRAKIAGKTILLHETGWSTGGTNPVVTEASPRAQGVFTDNFLTLASRQNIKTYYFSAFDLAFGDDIEKNFGVHDVNRNMKPAVAAIKNPARLQAVRLKGQGKVVKVNRHWNADNSVNNDYGRIYAEAASSGASGIFDDEIWLWDAANNLLYSKSADVCLDSFVDGNGIHNLHTWYCAPGNVNQQWNPSNNNLSNQKYCMDIDLERPKTNDGKLVVQMWPCIGHPNQAVAMVRADQDPIEIGIHGAGALTEWYGQVTWETERKWNGDCHQWFYDPVTQLIKSKSNAGMCLDAYERKNDGTVHLYYCDENNANQKWIYNDITGQIMHATHLGYCLDGYYTGPASGPVHLWECTKTTDNQKWGVKLLN
ncbi:Aste57867_2372 [Aphanomyces stellatus]|uniref:glucan endo-1,3-beta-D-glucosidase n=1 Tax=Aphanomyces stellatus TaxID=120398 RepID=A0A485K7H9_9STRA|nr:hypothetical protein As57867_002367 [Aphanomyces stellatus]VFT79573.1 Aste57867_2372 [Aphanomyces stellatus]